MPNPRCRLSLFLCCAALTGALTSCEKKPRESAVPLPSSPFSIPAQAPETLSIQSRGLDAEARFDLTVKRDAQGRFQIEPIGSALAFKDRVAHQAYLNHLVETLRTLKVVSATGSGTDARFGFDPPRWHIEWSLLGEKQSLALGVVDSVTEGVFARIRKGDDAWTVILKGALIPLLSYAPKLKDWREPHVLPLVAARIDAVDRVFPKPEEHWTREGSAESPRWRKRSTGKIDSTFGAQLERVLHLRFERIDDASDPTSPPEHSPKPLAELRFRTSPEHWETLKLVSNKPLILQSSLRPKARFQLYSQSLEALQLK